MKSLAAAISLGGSIPAYTGPSTDTVEGAALIVSYFQAIGVEYVFGVPGGAIEPLYNALAVSSRNGGPKPVLARHEAGAAFMADGYARETGRLGVCVATSGPGATNLLTGVACAYDNSVPLLAITGQPSLPLFGKRALVIARGAAGAVEQGAERSDQQYAKDQGHVAPRRGAPAPVLFIDHFAFRHIPLH